jgi:hypothetical protein
MAISKDKKQALVSEIAELLAGAGHSGESRQRRVAVRPAQDDDFKARLLAVGG